MDNKAKIKAVLQLGKHLRGNCDKILNKSVPFVVDSALLWFIMESIQSILNSTSPQHEAAAAFCSDIASEELIDKILFIADFISQTPSLCLTINDSIPGNIDLSLFRSLCFLELRKIPPHMIVSLSAVKANLQKLKCSRCLDSLSEILSSQRCSNTLSRYNNNNFQDSTSSSLPSSTTSTLSSFPSTSSSSSCSSTTSSVSLVWPELKEIDLSFNRITDIDLKATEHFQLTPLVEYLNLSRNSILSIDDSFSRVLNQLTTLNLNYNKLKTIPMVPINVKTLLLSHNYISSLSSPPVLQSLPNIQVLDLSTNMISDENELDILNNLRQLRNLVLIGNPISYLEDYRHTVCCSINRVVLNRAFVLDNKKLSISQVRRALESMKNYKFVPFNVAPTAQDEDDRNQQQQKLSPSSTLTQSYDSSSTVRSSCRKKPKIRPVHVFDPDDLENQVSNDDKLQSDSNSIKNLKDTENISESEVRSEINALRAKYGEENWLLRQAGVEVGKLLKIPVVTSYNSHHHNNSISNATSNNNHHHHNKNSMTSLLSKSLPLSGNSSLYTTALEFNDSQEQRQSFGKNHRDHAGNNSKDNKSVDDKDNSDMMKTCSSFDDKHLDACKDDSNSAIINDDSLIFYPGSSTTNSNQCTTTGNTQRPQEQPSSQFRFTSNAATTTASFVSKSETFSDPHGKGLEFRYFQSGKMYKLVILDNYLYDIDREDSTIVAKWDLKSLETIADEKNETETETVEFKLIFDTVKKNLREKSCVMSNKEFARFDEAINPFLEVRTMKEFLECFQCLKCNAQFSKGMADKTICQDPDGIPITIPVCNNPDCRSELLVELDSIPLPNNESLNVENELLNLKDSIRSPSPMSSLGHIQSNSQQLFRVPLACSTPKPMCASSLTIQDHILNTDQPVILSGVSSNTSQCYVATRKKSKSSSEPASLTVIRSDSDIETLSCTSSSIEVIGNNADSGSGSDIAEVQEAIELTEPVCEQKSNQKSLQGQSQNVTMTDSASSGTESVCTQYENKAAVVAGNSHSVRSYQQSPNSLFSTSMNSSSSTATLLNTQTPSYGIPTSSPFHQRLASTPIKYDYEDFSKVDHRLQLFCEISVFKGSDEKLLALAKVHIFTEYQQFPSVVIFSNQKLYIYRIVGLEGDKPDSWLQKVKSHRLEKLVCINVLIGRHGVGVDLQGKYYALVFRDSERTSSFLECFLGNICGELEFPPLVRDLSQSHKAFLSPTNSVVYFGVLMYASCETGKSFLSAAVMVTDIEVLLITDLSWLGSTRNASVTASQVQQLNTLRQVESHENDETYVRLIFGSANHVFWELYFETPEERRLFLTNIQPFSKKVPFISLSQPIEP